MREKEKEPRERQTIRADQVGALPLDAILPPAAGPHAEPAAFDPMQTVDATAARMKEAAPGMPVPQITGMAPAAAEELGARVSLAWLAVDGVAGALVRAAETLKADQKGPERKGWVVANLVKYASHAEGLFQLEPGSLRSAVEFLADDVVERIFLEQVQGGHVNRGTP